MAMAIESPPPPIDFDVHRARVHLYLDTSLEYAWRVVGRRHDFPVGECCIILCVAQHGVPNCRCLAYAVRMGRRICWFGITASHHWPEELYGVRGYLPVKEVEAQQTRNIACLSTTTRQV